MLVFHQEVLEKGMKGSLSHTHSHSVPTPTARAIRPEELRDESFVSLFGIEERECNDTLQLSPSRLNHARVSIPRFDGTTPTEENNGVGPFDVGSQSMFVQPTPHPVTFNDATTPYAVFAIPGLQPGQPVDFPNFDILHWYTTPNADIGIPRHEIVRQIVNPQLQRAVGSPRGFQHLALAQQSNWQPPQDMSDAGNIFERSNPVPVSRDSTTSLWFQDRQKPMSISMPERLTAAMTRSCVENGAQTFHALLIARPRATLSQILRIQYILIDSKHIAGTFTNFQSPSGPRQNPMIWQIETTKRDMDRYSKRGSVLVQRGRSREGLLELEKSFPKRAEDIERMFQDAGK